MKTQFPQDSILGMNFYAPDGGTTLCDYFNKIDTKFPFGVVLPKVRFRHKQAQWGNGFAKYISPN